MKEYKLDPNDLDSTFLYDIYSEKWGNKFYQMRAGFGLEVFGGENFKDILLGGDHDSIVSLPLYCQMGGISLNELEYEQINIRLKPEYNNREWIRDVFFHHYT